MAVATDGVHSSVQAIQNMEAACARFARALVERLPEIERELRQTTEALEDHRSNLRREIADLNEKISSADEEDDMSWERQRVEEVEDKLASVQQRIRRVSEVSAIYSKQARTVEHLANPHSIQAREFLNGAADDLKAYLAKDSRITRQIVVPQGTELTFSARFGNASSTDYRSTFFAAYPNLKDHVVVHHAVPQGVLKRYVGTVTEMEIHSLENLRGIPKAINNQFHQSLIKTEWNAFYRENPTVTKEQLLGKATEIDAKYGLNFLPPAGASNT